MRHNLENATEKDVFSFGTVAKISGVHARRTNDLALVLKGTRRFKIQEITQTKPFFEARVALLDEDGLLHYFSLEIRADSFNSRQYLRPQNQFIIRSTKGAVP